MATIRISQVMADTLQAAYSVEDDVLYQDEFSSQVGGRLVLRASCTTTVALMARGLVELVTSNDSFGGTSLFHVLTERGVTLRRLLINGRTLLSISEGALDRYTAEFAQDAQVAETVQTARDAELEAATAKVTAEQAQRRRDNVYRAATVEDTVYLDAGARVRDTATVRGKVAILGDSIVQNMAVVRDGARLDGHARVGHRAVVEHFAEVRGRGQVSDQAVVGGHSVVTDDAQVSGCSRVGDYASVKHQASVTGNARVHGDAVIDGYAHVGSDADVFRSSHVITLSQLPEWNYVTVYRTATGHRVQAGCQNFTLDEAEQVAAENDAHITPATLHLIEYLKTVVAHWHS